MPYTNKESAASKESRRKAMKKWRENNPEKWKKYRCKCAKRLRDRNKNNKAWVNNHNKQSAVSYYKNNVVKNEERRTRTDNLDDWYIIKQLKKDGIIGTTIRTIPEIIECKRLILKIKRFGNGVH